MIKFIICAVIAYLLGSISSAVLVCKFLGLPDPRSEGSKNPGATNVLRIGGKQAALLTLIGDALKGFVAVLIARLLGVVGFELAFIAVFAFLGHLFPVFFQFQGGRGVATAFGALLALAFPVAIVALITWILVLVFSRYASLASVSTAVLTPIYTLLFADFSYFIPVLIMCILLIWRHWENIRRLKEGTETKVNF
jgi:glycerol-3-phosphate acyltransferase PlsY